MVDTHTFRSLSQRDLNRLGFKEPPFHPSADPRFLYLSPNHVNLLNRLLDTIEWQEGLAVVEGHMGTGKTSLARRLYDLIREDDTIEPTYVHTAAFKTPMEAARDIAAAFNQPGRRSNILQLRHFEKFLVDLRIAGKTAVVILDDAQFMEPDSLDTIQSFLNFDVNRKLIQIIMFGQQEIKSLFIKKPAVHNRVRHWQSIGSLPFTEMVQMINFRTTVAGRPEPLFTEPALERLWNATQGVPRPLVLICADAVRLLIETKSQFADEEIVEQAIEMYNQRPEIDLGEE